MLFVAGLTYSTWGQVNLITNIQNRKTISLNGKWQYLVDPYETGFYDYRYHELAENNPDAYWNSVLQEYYKHKSAQVLEQ